MQLKRNPLPALRPFVQLLWASDENEAASLGRERLLPTAAMHLVFRLSQDPIRIYRDEKDWEGQRFDLGTVAGIRAGYYVKARDRPGRTVGALLKPGASPLLFGIPANELTDRHVSVGDVLGSAAGELAGRMHEAKNLVRQLELFEAFLASRLPRVTSMHPAIAHALARLPQVTSIGKIVEETGYSHRRFIELFRQSIGLPPRLYSRLLRFQEALRLARRADLPWVEIAIAAGYSDQAHFIREFRELAGVTPGEYRKAGTDDAHHLPIGGGKKRSIPDGDDGAD